MSNEENKDNFYILEDDSDMEQSPLNFAAYNDSERESEKEDVAIASNEKRTSIGMLFHIMFSPVEGWKGLRRSSKNVESLQSGLFYPLLALLAISKFADFFYSVNVSLSQLVTEAVVAFVAFFFSYFSVHMVLSWILPKDMTQKFDCAFGKEFILIALSTLVVFSIVTNLLPMLWPLLIFLPIWTLYIMFKGIRFFKFQINQDLKFFVLASGTMIGMPLLIEWILNTILPY